ncbi:hypothetical protein [Mangrovimonas sp. YM274]|uniref:hypothetical protein n=1 Tax=Mangrovimonas sp. YM274 TaxID=3070660 RepID=UPI0027DB9D11|nr:hypothetical protein [Mangrovimonas sp. YM274]WMI69820.1 hypothetical protein RBH95_05540 [Mangrovimonas sp. YM274]
MKTIMTHTCKSLLGLFLLVVTFSVSAQQKLNKVSQSIKVTDDVTINLNTSHVQIEVDTWNRDVVEIEAYVESDKLSAEELKKAMETWKLTVEGSGDLINIQSKELGTNWNGVYVGDFDFDYNFEFDALRDLEFELAQLPELPELPEMPEVPALPDMKMPEMPALPELPALPEGIHNVHFDTDAYKKEGEKYLEEWSREYEKKYGAAYKEKMKAWAKEMGKVDFKAYEEQMKVWGEAFGKQFGEEFEVKMEDWSKQFDEEWGKAYEERMREWEKHHERELELHTRELERRQAQQERRQAQMEQRLEAQQLREEERMKRFEERQRLHEQRRADLERSMDAKQSKVKRVIKVKMPKDAKLKLDVRHGELKLSSTMKNLRGDLSHTTLLADHIDGKDTSINVAYSPIWVEVWEMGELKLDYVEEAHIKSANRLVLSSNSSNIGIEALKGNAVINGSFGDLTIGKIEDSFQNLNVMLENSDAIISLPKTDHHLQYNGNRSRFSHPEKEPSKNTSSFSNNLLSSDKSIVINAKFSHVTMR